MPSDACPFMRDKAVASFHSSTEAPTCESWWRYFTQRTVLNINSALFLCVNCLYISPVDNSFVCIVYADKMLLITDEFERTILDKHPSLQ